MATRCDALQVGQTVHVEELDYGFRLTVLDPSQPGHAVLAVEPEYVLLGLDEPELLFAYRRKVYKELICDKRDKPMKRRRLKALKRQEQNGLCAL